MNTCKPTPFSSTRLTLIENAVKKQGSGVEMPQKLINRFSRIKLKILAFSHPPRTTIMMFPESDQSINALYVRAIAYFKLGDYKIALKNIKSRLSKEPADPYAHELHGQILFSNGDVREAQAVFKKAISLAPHDSLLRLAYVEALLENKTEALPEALKQLQIAESLEPDNPRVKHYMALVYGRQGNMDLVALSLAEKNFIIGNYRESLSQSTRALALTKDKRVRLHATDIQNASKTAIANA